MDRKTMVIRTIILFQIRFERRSVVQFLLKQCNISQRVPNGRKDQLTFFGVFHISKNVRGGRDGLLHGAIRRCGDSALGLWRLWRFWHFEIVETWVDGDEPMVARKINESANINICGGWGLRLQDGYFRRPQDDRA